MKILPKILFNHISAAKGILLILPSRPFFFKDILKLKTIKLYKRNNISRKE
jgi:hypothetical protein